MSDQAPLGYSVGIEIRCDAVLYYATAVNGPGIIRNVRLKVNRPQDLVGTTLTLAVTSLGEVISFPWSHEISTVNQTVVDTGGIPIKYRAEKLFAIRDSHPGEVEVTVSRGLDVIGKASTPIRVLSPDSWIGERQLDYLMLAAFSQPNDPAVAQIRDFAGDELARCGRPVQWSGYQDSSHVTPMVEAIYRAVVGLEFAYANPPGSWDLQGQRIRSAAKILEERVATCLDSAMLFSSLFEIVGLCPVIAMVPGHAFVGYWTEVAVNDHHLDRSQTPHIYLRDALPYLDAGLLKLFETTTAARNAAVDLSTAMSLVRPTIQKSLSEAEADEHHLVDIVACRRAAGLRIIPNPSVTVRADGSSEVHEYQPVEFTVNMLRDRLVAEASSQRTSVYALDMKVPPRVRHWLDSLLDLSRRNPLINFRTETSAGKLRNSRVPLVVAAGSLGLLEDLLQREQQLNLLPNRFVHSERPDEAPLLVDERGQALIVGGSQGFEAQVAEALSRRMILTQLPEQEFVKTFRRLAANAKSFAEETGSNCLYLALGTLDWRPSPDVHLRSPLILLPINILSKKRNTQFQIELDTSSNLTPNYSLIEKLKVDLGLRLPELENLQSDDAGVDIDGTFNHIRQELVKAGLTDFRVDENATIGLFDFMNYRLWLDLLQNWKTLAQAPLVAHLINRPGEEFEDAAKQPDEELDDPDALTARLPIPADGSQIEAIRKALGGQTFVLQGPPGTGKSQTIANLLAAALHEGKRILFVAQKKDALDVVKERLDAVGLGPFVLDLHDQGMSLKMVKHQLSSVLNVAARVDRAGFQNALASYNEALMPLQQYKERLHRKGALGFSFYAAIDNLLATPSDFTFELPENFIAHLSVSDAAQVLSAVRDIAVQAVAAGQMSENPWLWIRRARQFSSTDLATLRSLINQCLAIRASAQNSTIFSAVVDVSNTFDTDFESLLIAKQFTNDIVNAATDQSFRILVTTAKQYVATLQSQIATTGIDFGSCLAIDASAIRQALLEAQASFALVRPVRIAKQQKLLATALSQELPKQFDALLRRVDELVSWQDMHREITKAIEALRSRGVDAPTQVRDERALQELAGLLDSLATLGNLVDPAELRDSINVEVLKGSSAAQVQGAAEYSRLAQQLGELLEFSPERVELLTGHTSIGSALAGSLELWRSDLRDQAGLRLVRIVDLNSSLFTLEKFGLADLVQKVIHESIPYEELPASYTRAYYAAVANAMLKESGFETFNGERIDNYIQRLTAACGTLRECLPGVMASELLASRNFDGAARVGAIGDLVADLSNPRRGGSVRALMRKHWSVIQQLTPCVMATPDSVVRFLDAELPKFDLVIFDEASQMRVPNSIGALGRAKAAVIAGDTKQMPPTSVAQATVISAETDDQELNDFEPDLESILSQCLVARVPEVLLSWHYRSADEALIAFSNGAYYDNRLHTFPSPRRADQTAGVSLEIVPDGFFVREDSKGRGRKGVNTAEVRAVVAEVSRRLVDSRTVGDSIGIVTLNVQQRDAVREALQDSDDPNIQQAMMDGVGGEAIFVKNLETVQGSERDVILLSVGYSKNESGKLPLNFGPMNNAGGERRLNVAITRARKHVKVFCSFEPSELVDRDPVARGVRDLAEYLAFAQTGHPTTGLLDNRTALEIDRHRTDVATALRAKGFHVVEELGMSGFKVDVAVYKDAYSQQALLGILLDGFRWSQRSTVFDRDALPKSMLEQRMGWPCIERVWLPAWQLRREVELDRLIKRLQQLSEHSAPSVVEAQLPIPRNHAQSIITKSIADRDPLADMLEVIATFEPAPVRLVGTPTDIESVSARLRINQLVEMLTRQEGPVSPDRVTKFVGSCFGVERLSERKRSAILSHVDGRFQRDAEGFYYPPGLEPHTFRDWHRAGNTVSRNLADISLMELGNAAAAVAKAVQGIRNEQLVTQLLQVMGILRATEGLKSRASAAIELAESRRLLVSENGYLKLNA